uniref:Sulfotransferase domain-containing protein n=1 Tax=Tetranychus urticae TaxID=32264 RepID=T1KCI0_TETUR
MLLNRLPSVVVTSYYARQAIEKKSEILKEAIRLNNKIGRMTLYKFRDFILPEEVLPVIKQLPEIKFNSDDVILSTFPKTGVTWLQEIIWLIMNDYNFDKALLTNLEDRFPFLEWILPGISAINKKQSPRLVKTHLPLSILFNQETKIEPKVISITRNIKDVTVSYYFFARMNKLVDYQESIEMFVERFVAGNIAYGPLHRHYIDTLKYSTVDGNKVLIVAYEDLHNDFEGSVKRLCTFLGKPFPSDETMVQLKKHCDFRFMKVNPMVNYSHWDGIGLRNLNESQFFRAGKVGDWSNHLSKPCSELLDDYYELHFRGLFNFKETID